METFKFEEYKGSAPQTTSLWQKIKENNTYRMILGAVVGALAGWLYYIFVGCNSGGCAITSSPLKTVGFFALIGAFIANKNKCGGAC